MRFRLSVFLLFALTANLPAEWIQLHVPPEEQVPEAIDRWYRCRLQVPDRLTVPESNNPRDLWRSSTMLVLADLPEIANVFLNGRLITASQSIPLGQSKRFKVPKDILVAKEYNTLIIHLQNSTLTKVPMLIDYFNGLEIGPIWELNTTRPAPSDFLPVRDQPPAAYVTVAQFRPSTTPLDSTTDPIPGKRVPPAESLSALETDDDLIVEQLLHEPQVAQPTHVSFDARGRMWVSQYRQYPYPKGVKMLSRDQYYRSKYDRVPPAPPYHDRGADIISVHADTDGDGTYDHHKNILEGLNMANSALRGWGGFWVMHTPYLLFYPDADGDDVPDRAPEVRLAGFGLEDAHSVANGLVWGPDGWLYGGQGSTTTSRVTRPGVDPKDAPGIYNEGCMVWRYHPATREYEIFADGGGNTFGLSFDAEGRLFSGHNGGSTRGWHHIQEGQFLKQGKNPGKFGPPANPYTFGELQMMRSTNPVPRFSHMGVLMGGSAMPQRLQGKFLCADPLHHYLVLAERKPRGSTFETTDLGFPLRTDQDITFRPVYLANSPDGSMVVADFCEEFIAHGQNYQGQIDPTSGRIYRLRGRGEKLETDYNLESKSGAELVQILGHRNLWHRQTAARLLGQRRDLTVVPQLLEALRKPATHPAVDALWSLHQMGQLDGPLAIDTLSHPSPIVRAWTIRLLGDTRRLPPEFLEKLKSVGRAEPDLEVRSQILSTALRLPAGQAIPLVAETTPHLGNGSADLADPNIPAMAWFVFESHCEEGREPILELFENPDFWSRDVIREYVLPRLIRRFAEAGTREDLLTCARLFRLAPGVEASAILASGFGQAFADRIPPPFPPELLEQLGKGSLSMQIRQGKPEALAEGLALVSDSAAAQSDRLAAIHAFGTYRHRPAVPRLLALATSNDSPLQSAALGSLQIYDSPEIASALTLNYKDFPRDLRAKVLSLLGTRKAWAIALLESDLVPKSGFDPDLLARMRLHDSPQITALLDQYFPSDKPADPGATAGAIRKILAAKPGDAYRGEPLYAARCASCHTLFFKGGKVGPDLTRYQRDDLSTMLISILEPNAEIREGFENHIVITRDDRILSGFLAEEYANTIVLRGFDDSTITIPRDRIKELKPAGRSLMPEGLLTGLDDQQLRDLFAYLRISQPIIK